MLSSRRKDTEFVRRFLTETTDSGESGGFDDYVTTDVVYRDLLFGDYQGVDATREAWNGIIAGFDEFDVDVEDAVAEGETVAVRAIVRGTHEKEILGLEPTGEAVEIPYLCACRLEEGRITEFWSVPARLVQHLDVVDASEAPPVDGPIRTRAAARAAIDDVAPPPFRDAIDRRLRGTRMTPAVLTWLAARTVDPDGDSEGLERRGAGVQLIYEGLRLTRTLAHSPPWDAADEREIDADIEILVATVLVARGFALLAGTEASSKAVETIRAFGRDETNRRVERHDPTLPDHALETDVFELGIVAGISATGTEPPGGTRTLANRIADVIVDRHWNGTTPLSESALRTLSERATGCDDPSST